MSLKHGDTIIEILFALSIFSLVAILSINLMNNGVTTAQSALEANMVRNEVNAQAEALRFIHGSVTAGSSGSGYTTTWQKIVDQTKDNKDLESNGYEYPPISGNAEGDHVESCDDYYRKDILKNKNAFILNTRHLVNDNINIKAILSFDENFEPAQSYSRLSYKTVEGGAVEEDKPLATDRDALVINRVQGIWIIGVPSMIKDGDNKPQYYDFYIHSCWYNAGKNTPSTIGTVIRLYRPAGAAND